MEEQKSLEKLVEFYQDLCSSTSSIMCDLQDEVNYWKAKYDTLMSKYNKEISKSKNNGTKS